MSEDLCGMDFEMQGEYRIQPTGIVDVRTWTKIKELRA